MYQKPSSVYGFTLLELMVVIVIMAVVASLVMMNFSGVDHRKAMQAREIFILDLKKINRESNDQSKIFALNIRPSTDGNHSIYNVSEYQVPSADIGQEIRQTSEAKTIWKTYSEFNDRELPEKVSIEISNMDYQFQNAQNENLLNTNAPKLIWFGNGEVKPVRIQFYLEQQPIGGELQIDYLGKINES